MGSKSSVTVSLSEVTGVILSNLGVRDVLLSCWQSSMPGAVEWLSDLLHSCSLLLMLMKSTWKLQLLLLDMCG